MGMSKYVRKAMTLIGMANSKTQMCLATQREYEELLATPPPLPQELFNLMSLADLLAEERSKLNQVENLLLTIVNSNPKLSQNKVSLNGKISFDANDNIWGI